MYRIEYVRSAKTEILKNFCRNIFGQVRSEKLCVTGGESPSGLAARPLEFETKVTNGKV